MSKLVLGGVNNEMLRSLLMGAKDQTAHVQAAVAYVTDAHLLFEWCDKNSIPLAFWGRFDDGMPIRLSVLNWFRSRSSLNIKCKLVRKHHAKVIWWHGYGVYIGSANLTDAAWYHNFEAGIFLTEDDLDQQGMREDLQAFFRVLDQKSSPLTAELMALFEKRAKDLSSAEKLNNSGEEFENTSLVTSNDGFNVHDRRDKKSIAEQDFIDEWNSTLEVLRSISNQIVARERVPDWVENKSASGAIVDQFLHSHYYEKTFDGRKANYESEFYKNQNNPDAAIGVAMDWWHKLAKAPDGEDVMLNETAPKLKTLFTKSNLQKLTEADLKFITGHVHSMADHARRIPNLEQGLPVGESFTIDVKSDAFGRYLFDAK
ncbi:MAG: hypothetical protein KUG56_03650, partial [Kordiimonadaceae bacterium]|nr:hypothetical protein [Kordiimonadaceae bacterium]